MKIFALITVFAVLGGSHAFLAEIGSLFKNLGQELGEVGKDLLHVAEPVATSLLETLTKAGTQLLTTAASDLLSHLGTTAAGKRDLSEVIDKVGEFVKNGEDFLEGAATTLEGAYKYTLSNINEEIQHVLNDVKPLSGLIDEVKGHIAIHNGFIDELISQVLPEGEKLFNEIAGNNKRGLLDGALSFGQNLQQLIQSVAAPLKDALKGVVTKLESSVLSLLG